VLPTEQNISGKKRKKGYQMGKKRKYFQIE
jgi:hypothetical protein